MAIEDVKKLIESDIEDIKGLIYYKNDGLTEAVVKKQARAILLNLKDHFEQLVND